ncbi:hypothetical protein ACLOJK_014877 [Asimina triloba]
MSSNLCEHVLFIVESCGRWNCVACKDEVVFDMEIYPLDRDWRRFLTVDSSAGWLGSDDICLAVVKIPVNCCPCDAVGGGRHVETGSWSGWLVGGVMVDAEIWAKEDLPSNACCCAAWMGFELMMGVMERGSQACFHHAAHVPAVSWKVGVVLVGFLPALIMKKMQPCILISGRRIGSGPSAVVGNAGS